MKHLYYILVVILIGFYYPVSGQLEDPIDFHAQAIKTADNTFDLILTARIEKGWSTYSQEVDDDLGPYPTTIVIESDGVELLQDKAEECGSMEKKYDKVFEMDLVKFHGLAVFIQPIKVKDPSMTIKGYITMMCCDDEKCLPPTDYEFTIALSEARDIPSYDRNRVCKGKSIGLVSPSTGGTSDLAKEEEVEGDIQEIKLDLDSAASMVDPVKLSFSLTDNEEENLQLLVKARIQEGWKLYGPHPHGYDGPIQTKIFIDSLKGGADTMPGIDYQSAHRKVGYDSIFELSNISTFTQNMVMRKTFTSDANDGVVKGFVEYQACDNEKCLTPVIVPFVILMDKKVVYNPEEGLQVNYGTKGEGTPVFFSFDDSQNEFQCSEREETESENDQSFWWIFLAGFAGGFVALLTPCVFPMIPLTVSFFTKSSTDRASGIRNALTYGLSIIVIYVALGLIVTSVFGADALNLLSTNAWFNIFFFLLFVLFALSFFGLFEITLPSSWANKADRAADRGGLIGIFFMAFTLSLVSFSCTGPIIGTLLVETATGGGPTILGSVPAGPLVGMLGFSSALALPFALFAAFPSWLNSLPKSGSWMNGVKVVLGFVEVALALKFLSVADLTMGWNILPYELFVALWILCALGIAAYFFGILKLPLDYSRPKVTRGRAIVGILAVIVAGYIATGFQYSDRNKTFVTPGLLSGLAPPAGHSWIYPNECPLNLHCFKDFQEGMAFAEAENLPVLLDFTGHGCVNCRKMEDYVWSDEKIYPLISEKYVLISLYVDERTALDSSYVSAFDGKTKRTIGNKWADFQQIHFHRNSQPYYVLLSPQGRILNKPVGYTPQVATYESFLQCGIEEYNKECGNCLTER